jgi:hypothetical protein
MKDGKPALVKLPAINFIDDKDGKPIGIQTYIGRRPSPPSVTPTATCKCFSGPPPVPARTSAFAFTTPTPSASLLTTASRTSAS